MEIDRTRAPKKIKRFVFLLVLIGGIYLTYTPSNDATSMDIDKGVEYFAGLIGLNNVVRADVSASQDIDCATCHDQYASGLTKTVHGKAKLKTSLFREGQSITCQSCHGDGAEHVADVTDRGKMLSPAKLKPKQASATCLECHAQMKEHVFWQGSKHDMAGVSCLSCHSVHHSAQATMSENKLFATAEAETKLLKQRTEADTCYQCHGDIRKSQFQRSTHLFRSENRDHQITCSSCHEAHGGIGDKMTRNATINETCYECHTEKRGPYLYEHSPVRENCNSCHKAHGSNNLALLTSKPPMLCQQCHMQGRHQTVAGRPNLAFTINRSCTNCHSAIHGSNHPSGINLQR